MIKHIFTVACFFIASNLFAQEGAIGTKENSNEGDISAPPPLPMTDEAPVPYPASDEDLYKVFVAVEIEPSFPGGDVAWKKYLQRNLDTALAKNNGAPVGRYTAVVKFIVAKDGTISEIECDTDAGYGTCEEAIRVIKKGPKWVPAQQNGRIVNSYRRQKITFTVSE
ncbi:energy transducer TonB [Ferruginibacter sp. SUN002]|uniref:energy transducer TonB n=1 Tax=Ferruginibacter sp. SUN002 TaxID=2937789 RepID=UPI003D35FAE7